MRRRIEKLLSDWAVAPCCSLRWHPDFMASREEAVSDLRGW